MHGYYYDQNRVYPPEDQGRRRRPGRRGPGKAVVIFCCTLALLLVAAVVLRWVGDSLSPGRIYSTLVINPPKTPPMIGAIPGIGRTRRPERPPWSGPPWGTM